MGDERIVAIVIGRNEGERLITCLESLKGRFDTIIYVDSGSTDGSQDAARSIGAEVVPLDLSIPFTAARARNAGLDRASKLNPRPVYVQFLDGDCALQPNWLEAACAAMKKYPNSAVVCGRRRERFPQSSIYNAVIDEEWNTPVGQARSCGGDALMRMEPLLAVGGYRPSMIAGEEPELCVRLRAAGWDIWRIDAEMTLHDAAITRFGQWWQRSKRAGHAFAEGAALHGAPPERHNITARRRSVIWGGGFILALLLGLFVHPALFFILLLWPAQVLRLKMRGASLSSATLMVLGKLPEFQGVMLYYWSSFTGPRKLIEYK